MQLRLAAKPKLSVATMSPNDVLIIERIPVHLSKTISNGLSTKSGIRRFVFYFIFCHQFAGVLEVSTLYQLGDTNEASLGSSLEVAVLGAEHFTASRSGFTHFWISWLGRLPGAQWLISRFEMADSILKVEGKNNSLLVCWISAIDFFFLLLFNQKPRL